MPGGTRVRVTVRGDQLLDEFDQAVDADGDGAAGGTGVIEFETFPNAPVPATAVIGQVFASEPAVQGGQTVDRPLAGVTVTLDGKEETIRAVTDAGGRFVLQPVPAGRFFVHVDGRTSPQSRWPGGDYYPFVGKSWEAVAGRTNNLAGEDGKIYLPLVKAGTLQPVSQLDETPITFAPAVQAQYPELAGTRIVVPPDSLFSDAGQRGGRVGIAPVPPDRLPEQLPIGLDFPLVITVQTDGALNFEQPVPVRFPNLPDRTTGRRLAPGSQTALVSFDHRLGT